MTQPWTIDAAAPLAGAVAVLSADRPWAVYALGDLEPPFAQYSTVATAHSGAGAAACLVMRHPVFNVIVSTGHADGVAAILQAMELPARVFVSILPDHLPAFERHYSFAGGMSRMRRMPLEKFTRRREMEGVQALAMDDLVPLQTLYRSYPGSAFIPDHLEGGVFFGVRVGDELVAAAGTHVVSEQHSLAAIGNVFTLPDFRGRGFAEALTAAVVLGLKARGIELIVLNVAVENVGAARIYERLGFRDHCVFLEATGTLR